MAQTATYPNLQELISATQFLQQQQQYNMGGGAQGAFQEAQKQKLQQDSANRLQNYLMMSQQFPGMAPTQAVQQSAGAMFGNPLQQRGINLPGQQQNILPGQSPYQNQQQAQIESSKNLINYLSGIKDPTQQGMAMQMMGASGRPGTLNMQQYMKLEQDLSHIPDDLKNLMGTGQFKSEDDAKLYLYYQYIGEYGPNYESKIRMSLRMPSVSGYTPPELTGANAATQTGQKKKNPVSSFLDWLGG